MATIAPVTPPDILHGNVILSHTLDLQTSFTGHGTVTATQSQIAVYNNAGPGDTFALQDNSALWIGGFAGIPHCDIVGSKNAGMHFLGTVKMSLGDASQIDVMTTATFETYVKTGLNSGDFRLYNGTKEVADIHVTGANVLYANPTSSGVLCISQFKQPTDLPMFTHH